MTRRAGFDGERQARILKSLFDRSGRTDLTQAAAAAHISYPHFRRFMDGRQEARPDVLPLLSAALNVSERDLRRALSPDADEPAPEGWDLRAELLAANPHDAAAADRVYPSLAHLPYAAQADAVYVLRLAAGLEPRPDHAEDTHIRQTDQSRPSLGHTAG